MNQMKVCTKCNKRRQVSRFDKDATRPDGLYAQCKDCKHIPKRRKQINSVRAEAHADSVKKANRKGQPWSASDDKVVMDLSFRDAAAKTGRTYWSVAQRRWRLKNGKVKK